MVSPSKGETGNNEAKQLERAVVGILNELGLKHNTDKSSNHHDYLRLYEKRLQHLRAEKFVLFEFGVLDGGSFRTWCDYFPQATIVGIDINPNCAKFSHANGVIKIGDQSDTAFLNALVQEFGRPLVVIDDGSHQWDHQIITLQTLYSEILPGGLFVVEDIDTSFSGYTHDYSGKSPITAFDYIAKWTRHLVGDAANKERPYDSFMERTFKSVDSIEFSRRTCIITKKEQ